MFKKLIFVLSLILLICLLVGCYEISDLTTSINIKEYDRVKLEVGKTLQLEIEEEGLDITWSASNGAVTVDKNGLVTAIYVGKTAVSATCGGKYDTVLIEVVAKSDGIKPGNDNKDDGTHKPATSNQEATERSAQGIISGYITVPDQAPIVSSYRPMKDGKYILNSENRYIDVNTYAVVDAYGNEVFRVYRGGGYITLEEVAAYVYAFGDIPANYISGKNVDPEDSIWGEYLRLNHTKFSGSTTKYPYEPELPNISGCGGSLYYFEIDIGTTGTDCDPGYQVRTYNNGTSIVRGAARIVYGKNDLDRDGILEHGEHHVFYTYNHYNDFQEYLNYYGGWGEMFGNVTGGGTLSSKYDYNPTPYVPVVREALPGAQTTASVVYYFDIKRFLYCFM